MDLYLYFSQCGRGSRGLETRGAARSTVPVDSLCFAPHPLRSSPPQAVHTSTPRARRLSRTRRSSRARACGQSTTKHASAQARAPARPAARTTTSRASKQVHPPRPRVVGTTSRLAPVRHDATQLAARARQLSAHNRHKTRTPGLPDATHIHRHPTWRHGRPGRPRTTPSLSLSSLTSLRGYSVFSRYSCSWSDAPPRGARPPATTPAKHGRRVQARVHRSIARRAPSQSTGASAAACPSACGARSATPSTGPTSRGRPRRRSRTC